MHPALRALTVLAITGGLAAAGRTALTAAPGQNGPPTPVTTAQLRQLNQNLAAKAAQEEKTLTQLQQQELQLEGTIAQLQQQVYAYSRSGYAGGGRRNRRGGDDGGGF